MSNNGWILTSERMPTAMDAASGQVWCVRGGYQQLGHWMHMTGVVAWRPIDQPPGFVQPPKYRDVKWPDDWGKECEFKKTGHKKTYRDRLVGYDPDDCTPYIAGDGRWFDECKALDK